MVETVVEGRAKSIEQLMDEQVHWVCHCTNDDWSFCGLYLHDEPWNPNSDDDCPLCVLAANALSCPWGCECSVCAP